MTPGTRQCTVDKRDRPPVCGRQVRRDRPPVRGRQVRRDRPPVCGRQVRRDRPPVCGRQVRRAGDIAGERRENDVRVCSEVLNYSVVFNFFHFQDTYANVHVCTVCNIT